MYGYYYGNNLGYGLGAVGIFFDILWWFLIIILIVTIIRGIRKRHWYIATKTPVDILKERYAKGEITKQQFEDMKKDVS
ncbi:MAG: SHOCT domain-containing protein [Patescibacteria group bacterium]|nr:SHOCT domain-containing protein [Patescibacteria group bacterium]